MECGASILPLISRTNAPMHCDEAFSLTVTYSVFTRGFQTNPLCARSHQWSENARELKKKVGYKSVVIGDTARSLLRKLRHWNVVNECTLLHIYKLSGFLDDIHNCICDIENCNVVVKFQWRNFRKSDLAISLITTDLYLTFFFRRLRVIIL